MSKEQNISVRHQGRMHDIFYSVDDGVISVSTKYGSKTATLGDTAPQAMARMIFQELVKSSVNQAFK